MNGHVSQEILERLKDVYFNEFDNNYEFNLCPDCEEFTLDPNGYCPCEDDYENAH